LFHVQFRPPLSFIIPLVVHMCLPFGAGILDTVELTQSHPTAAVT